MVSRQTHFANSKQEVWVSFWLKSKMGFTSLQWKEPLIMIFKELKYWFLNIRMLLNTFLLNTLEVTLLHHSSWTWGKDGKKCRRNMHYSDPQIPQTNRSMVLSTWARVRYIPTWGYHSYYVFGVFKVCCMVLYILLLLLPYIDYTCMFCVHCKLFH